jgi:hypothetical protein
VSDYKEQYGRPAAGLVGTPMLAVRKDKPADLTGGTDQALAMPQLDSAGNLRVTEEGGKATYFAVSQFSCDATGTDIWHLPGVAGKTAHLQYLIFNGAATATAQGDVSVLRRSTLDTGQTAVAPTIAQADTGDAAASLAPQHFTAHPTALGTSAGVLWGMRYIQPALAGTTAGATQGPVLVDFRQFNGGKGLRIQGATDVICLNIAAALGGAGNVWDVVACWTEEPTTA